MSAPPPSDSKIRLIDALAQQFPDSSKRTLKQWIDHGRVLVNGQPPTTHLIDKDSIVDIEKKQLAPLPIVYEDSYLVAINKPSGLLSVPTTGTPLSALNILRGYYRCPTLYAAHRLDEGASGVLLFVRGAALRETMAAMFGAHDLIREYHAIVEGKVAMKEGVWEFPLEELESYQVIVSDEGRSATTHFRCLRRTPLFSHLHVELKTGRKHQIRVHTSHVGHPIIGDRRYGSQLNPLKRLGLHAKRLAFTHPITGKWLELRAPLPKGFDGLGASLNQKTPQTTQQLKD